MNNNFANTGITLSFFNATALREVSIPSADAIRWDGADASTNAAITTGFHGHLAYCEIKITGRKLRNFGGSIGYGWKAQIKFTSARDESIDGPAEWSDCVILDQGEAVRGWSRVW